MSEKKRPSSTLESPKPSIHSWLYQSYRVRSECFVMAPRSQARPKRAFLKKSRIFYHERLFHWLSVIGELVIRICSVVALPLPTTPTLSVVFQYLVQIVCVILFSFHRVLLITRPLNKEGENNVSTLLLISDTAHDYKREEDASTVLSPNTWLEKGCKY